MTSRAHEFSDATFVLQDVQHRERTAAERLSEDLPWNPAFDACRGDGWERPFMVRAVGRVAVGQVRGFAASGAIVDGHGSGGASRFDVIVDPSGRLQAAGDAEQRFDRAAAFNRMKARERHDTYLIQGARQRGYRA